MSDDAKGKPTVTWSYEPAPTPADSHTVWRFELRQNGRIVEGSGRSRSARKARKELRRAIRLAETERP